MKKEDKPSNMDIEEIKKRTCDLPSLIEYAHSVGGFAITPTKQGVIKGKAMEAMKDQTGTQLNMILEQMRVLAKQAQQLKDRVEVSEIIYRAEINFVPDIHQIYFLYLKDNGKTTLSLISKDEWGDVQGYQKCLAKVRLLADHTWEIVERYGDLWA